MFEEFVNDKDYFHYLTYGQWTDQEQDFTEELTNFTTDELLDMYNDYDKLHKEFNDEIYKIKMDQIITILRNR